MNRQLVTTALIILFSLSTFAQEGDDKEKSPIGGTFALHMGPYLPNQIEGIEEIQPFWGFRYGFPVKRGLLEIGGMASNAEGVTMYNGSISLRGDYRMDDLIAMVYIGIDCMYYSPPAIEYKVTGGGHLGGGFLTQIGQDLYFRSEMKFHVNPGTALYIGFGLEFQFPKGEDSGDEEES